MGHTILIGMGMYFFVMAAGAHAEPSKARIASPALKALFETAGLPSLSRVRQALIQAGFVGLGQQKIHVLAAPNDALEVSYGEFLRLVIYPDGTVSVRAAPGTAKLAFAVRAYLSRIARDPGVQIAQRRDLLELLNREGLPHGLSPMHVLGEKTTDGNLELNVRIAGERYDLSLSDVGQIQVASAETIFVAVPRDSVAKSDPTEARVGALHNLAAVPGRQ